MNAELWCVVQIFGFSLTEDDMSALRGLDRGWKACILDE